MNRTAEGAGLRYDDQHLPRWNLLSSTLGDPNLDRFLTADSHAAAGNAYSYSSHNLVACVDPSGHILWMAVGMVIGTVGWAIYGAYTSY